MMLASTVAARCTSKAGAPIMSHGEGPLLQTINAVSVELDLLEIYHLSYYRKDQHYTETKIVDLGAM